ncbi:MAG: helicase [Ignavibacteria bacterium]|nr:helicase [Ignavibacteria bacterium]
MSFNNILEKYRKLSYSEHDKGARFERLMQAFLQTDPLYSYRFKKVWLWNEFHGRSDLGGGDTGIDLVAMTNEGDYWAVQCKCYQENAIIDKPAVDSFLSTSSKEFKNEQLKTVSFSQRLWISTTNHWGPNATEAIKNQNPSVIRLSLNDLQVSPVEWEKLEKGIHGDNSRIAKKPVFPHIFQVRTAVNEYYKNNNRGKLIMACGTGKTIASLKISEFETNGNGLILILVPSIALISQTLREWSSQADEPINAICICSDPAVSKKKNEDNDSTSVIDLALPASTNPNDIFNQFWKFSRFKTNGLTVVFSTYQSIEVISNAQKELQKKLPQYGEFDLIICDEAHRTTGVTLTGEDDSSFVKVHDNDFIKAKKRLYMTATPRLYSDDVKSKAVQAEAILCSMDDKKLYGEEIYRIGFGEAVERDLLTDYKVLILTLSDKDVPPAVQKMISGRESEINTDDASKLIGCINALSKQILGDEGIIKVTDPEPMRRAVAFCQSIAASKKITDTFNKATDSYISSLPAVKKEQMVSVNSDHIDGTMSAPLRDEKLSWLKAQTQENECRVLTNVRCLSEGVDVPSLDAVMFLSARNSQVDVVQSVGRVMRKAPGKKYGYIIIPVLVPSDVDASKALDDNERYKVVWTVLNALRAHDDRFNATVNKIELNKKRPEQIMVGGTEYAFDKDGQPIKKDDTEIPDSNKEISRQLALQFEQLQNIVFARMVLKVGDRRYWEQWAKSVAEIAERQVERINRLINEDKTHKKAFANFLSGLQKNINPSISQQEAVEMLSQHIITKPVFEALFEGYSFVKKNPISVSMQTMLDLLEGQAIEKDTETLQKFYESVKMRAAGIDNADGKQRIIIELYDKFFKTAFPKMVEKLGIVYTPVEVVDFIIHSVNDVLKKEFNRSISDENIHILDPFTGTGTFITRLLQSGLIEKKDLERKYKHEIHANEIVLLAYYIAAVNIENAYHDAIAPSPLERAGGEVSYIPFDGICLTDTFQLGETDESEKFFSDMFPQNSARVARQKKAPLRVIFGNPPYSVGQNSANDNAQNQKYEKLEAKIEQSYVKESSANLKNALYDSYIKAFRWSSDRLDKNGGIICFVSNGSWLDGNSADGFRKCLVKEFSSIYVFNLRGNQRTSGELSRKEGGKIFGSGSRTPIAITLLVKNPCFESQKANIYYKDIGEYLNREEKLAIVKKCHSISNDLIELITLKPNEYGDWISKRNDYFASSIPIDPEKNFDSSSKSFFWINGPGVMSGRDVWISNFSKKNIEKNIKNMFDYYNKQCDKYTLTKKSKKNINVDDIIETDLNRVSWSINLKSDVVKGIKREYKDNIITIECYRPFSKTYIYWDKTLIERPGISSKIFPTPEIKNFAIVVSGIGSTKDFSTLITEFICDRHFQSNDQYFPLYYYEERQKNNISIFDEGSDKEFIRRDGISDFILERAKKQYGLQGTGNREQGTENREQSKKADPRSPTPVPNSPITKEDIFYYVYGFLHSPEYREKFANDLKKMLPRLPLLDDVRDFWAFSKAGRKLAELHINYESVPAAPGVIVLYNTIPQKEINKALKTKEMEVVNHRVEKMRFPSKGNKNTIIYNSQITIDNIPDKAYEYVVNGKSVIEWIMERYQVTVHKESGIKNDPNDWADEVGNPRYILNLLLSIINVSIQTVDIVASLPKLKFE